MRKLDNIIEDGLKDKELEVPEIVWNNIKKKINSKKKVSIFWWSASSAAVIGILIFIGLKLYPSNDLKIKKVNENQYVDQNLTKDHSQSNDEIELYNSNTKHSEIKKTNLDLFNNSKKIDLKDQINQQDQKIKKHEFKNAPSKTEIIVNTSSLEQSTVKRDAIKTNNYKTKHTVSGQSKTTNFLPSKEPNELSESAAKNTNSTPRNTVNKTRSSPNNITQNTENKLEHEQDSENESMLIHTKNEENDTTTLAIESHKSSDTIQVEINSTITNAIKPTESSDLIDSIETKSERRLFADASIGYSTYKLRTWDQSFVFGMLSNRPFKSHGLEVSATIGYHFTRWLNPQVSFAFNQKLAQFTYAAVYNDRGYLDYDLNGRNLELNQINSNDPKFSNRYILNNIDADFKINTFAVNIENAFHLLRTPKYSVNFSLGIDLAITSRIKTLEITKINVIDNLSQNADARVSAGIYLMRRVSDKIDVFIKPKYIFSPQNNTHSFRRGNSHEIIYNGGIRYYF